MPSLYFYPSIKFWGETFGKNYNSKSNNKIKLTFDKAKDVGLMKPKPVPLPRPPFFPFFIFKYNEISPRFGFKGGGKTPLPTPKFIPPISKA